MGAASLVLGIVSLVLAIVAPGIGWVAAILGIVGIVLASNARKQGQGGVATAGLVLSILGLVFGVITYLACVACISAAEEALTVE